MTTTDQDRAAYAWETITYELAKNGYDHRYVSADGRTIETTNAIGQVTARVCRDGNEVTVYALAETPRFAWSAKFVNAPEFVIIAAARAAAE